MWPEPGTSTIGGPLIVFGIMNCTYICPVMIAPGGVGPAGPVPRWADWIDCPPTKKLPASCSSSGPPSEPAAALASDPNHKSVDSVTARVALLVMAASLRFVIGYA